MKTPLPAVALACVLAATLMATPKTYPIAPIGEYTGVILDFPNDFIVSTFSTDFINGHEVGPPAIGDNIGQHPGGFIVGGPPVGTSFIGIFGGPINVSLPDNAVYLWETTSPGGGGTGPQIQLGNWSGVFTPCGSKQFAQYEDTTAHGTSGLTITSSRTPLSAFGVGGGCGSPLNAIRITAAGHHDQVTAAGINGTLTTPEPATVLLSSAAVLLFFVLRTRCRRR